jgi:putative transposase
MLPVLRLLRAAIFCLFRSRSDLIVEVLALRQQLAVLKTRKPQPRFNTFDRVFWVFARKFWPNWKSALILVTPETVVRWHRAGFRLYWSWISHSRYPGRKRISRELRELIFQMVGENPTWGALRIHGELLKLGFEVSERTVLRWVQRAPKDPEPAQRWEVFLANHREVIAAMDFFTVPTLNFGLLYCFFVISHDRRKIPHLNVTKHPTSAWVVQQLRQAFPDDSAPKYLIHDRDTKFGLEVEATLRSMGIQPTRTSFRSPWQNGVAERFVGSCRRDLLDHVIVLNQQHLRRLLRDYLQYYHEDRTHLGLNKETPGGRETADPRFQESKIIPSPRLGGLHHRYDLAA